MSALKIIPSKSIDELVPSEIRDFISGIEAELLKQPQVDLPVKHFFSKDVYAREMSVAKGVILVGKIHKHQNMNIISKGKVSVLSLDGVQHFEAPYTFVASPGAKRVIFAHEDTVWTTIHGTGEQDLEKIEQEFIAKTYEEVAFIGEGNLKWLGE